MSVIASVYIYHPPFNIHYHTIEEEYDNATDALENFSKLGDQITNLEKDNETVLLETTSGYVMLNKKFLTDSVLRLSIFERD